MSHAPKPSGKTKTAKVKSVKNAKKQTPDDQRTRGKGAENHLRGHLPGLNELAQLAATLAAGNGRTRLIDPLPFKKLGPAGYLAIEAFALWCNCADLLAEERDYRGKKELVIRFDEALAILIPNLPLENREKELRDLARYTLSKWEPKLENDNLEAIVEIFVAVAKKEGIKVKTLDIMKQELAKKSAHEKAQAAANARWSKQ